MKLDLAVGTCASTSHMPEKSKHSSLVRERYNFYLSDDKKMKSPQSKKEANSSPNNFRKRVPRGNLDKELDGSISPDRGVLTDPLTTKSHEREN